MSAVTAIAAAAGAFGATAAAAAPARPAGGNCSPSVSSQPFGSAFDSYANKTLPVNRFTLSNCRGLSAKILSYGGIVQEINAPGRNGQQTNVVLGFKTLADYIKFDSPPVTANGGPYFGEIIGRYGNRIAKGTFKLNGTTYHLPINNNGNSLHGGLVGFGNHVWAAKETHGKGTAGVQLTLVSPNGDQGYPATLKVVVTYTINNAGQLGIHYTASNESKTLATVVNLTNHSYFNLAGQGSAAARRTARSS